MALEVQALTGAHGQPRPYVGGGAPGAFEQNSEARDGLGSTKGGRDDAYALPGGDEQVCEREEGRSTDEVCPPAACREYPCRRPLRACTTRFFPRPASDGIIFTGPNIGSLIEEATSYSPAP
ncbi:MAG: hypothetical protein R6X33_10370 [Candidatus Brocadiia bacterium]